MAFSWNSKNVPDVRYAIIGNGFDLECKLQTRYGDFLSFVREDKHIGLLPGITPAHPVDWQALKDYNFWYKWFEYVKIGNGWVDFENEIAKVVTTVERCMVNADGSPAFIDDVMRWDVLCERSPRFGEFYRILSECDEAIQTFRDLVNKLLDDLRMLTRCLESFLYDYASKNPLETDVTKGLVKLLGECGTSRVISFNYTKTLEHMLESQGIKTEFCYVHVAIGDGSDKNRMVLGIDEHLEPSQVGAFIEFGPFRKYNQRIYKQTDSRYMTWLEGVRSVYEVIGRIDRLDEEYRLSPGHAADDIDQIRRNIFRLQSQYGGMRRNSEVIILGHSLGITDKDILKPFITLPDTRTVVYHHNEYAFSSQVSNMTAILGMVEVISRSGGSNRTLEFRNQDELA